MSHAGTFLGLGVVLGLLNWTFVQLFNWPVIWCSVGWLPLRPWLSLVNLALALLLIGTLVWQGLWRGFQVAVVLVGVNVLPNLLAAVFNIGGRC